MARKPCASIPIRCQSDRARRTRLRPPGMLRPARDPTVENQSCRELMRVNYFPMETHALKFLRREFRMEFHTLRGAIPLRWAILCRTNESRLWLLRGSHIQAN